MATFALDPAVPFSRRLAAYADALEAEGGRDRAAEVRRAVRVYRVLVREGEVIGALESLAALRLPWMTPSSSP